VITAELLAALAQVEGAGNRCDAAMELALERNPFEWYAPPPAQ